MLKNENEQSDDRIDSVIESTPGFKRRINKSYNEYKVSGGIYADALIQKLRAALRGDCGAVCRKNTTEKTEKQ